MKYTRLEIRRSISNSRFKFFIEFFLIIPVIAIISGSLITKIFIAPLTSRTSSAPVDAVVPVNLNNSTSLGSNFNTNINNEYKVFILQAGAFVSKKNADVLQNGIKSNGTNAFVIKDLDVFRVIIDISQDKKMLIEKKDKLKGAGYGCLINEITLKNISVNETDEETAIRDYMDSLMKLLSVEVGMKESIEKADTVNLDEFNSNVLNISEKYKKVIGTNTNSKLTPVIAAFNEKLTKGTDNFKIGLEKKDVSICQQNAAEHALVINSFSSTVIQTFVK